MSLRRSAQQRHCHICAATREPTGSRDRLRRVSETRTVDLVSKVSLRCSSATSVSAVVAVVAALISFAVTLARLPALLAAVFRFSDAPELSYIAQGLATGHGPQLLPTQTSIGVIWFDELLQPVPFHAGIEYWTGPFLALVMAAVMVRTAHLVLGRRGAMWTCVMLMVLPAVVLWPLLFPDNHITTYVASALLAWHLVLDLGGRRNIGRSIAVGVIAGVGLVTDPQLLAFAVVPYIATVAVLRRGMTAQQARSVLFTAAAAVVAVGLSYVAMHAQGIQTVALLPGGGGVGGVGRGLVLAVQTLAWTIGGGWYGDAISGLAIGLSIAVVVVIAAIVIKGLRERFVNRPAEGLHDMALAGYGMYWGLAFACLLGAFVLLGYGAGGAPAQGHYLVGCYFAAAALLPPMAAGFVGRSVTTRRFHAGITGLVAAAVFTLIAVDNAVAIATFDASQYFDRLQVPVSDDPLPVLLQHGLLHGYAGYWESYDLDWRSGGAVSVWPLLGGAQACTGGAASLCPYAFAPRGEYKPTGGQTFIITPWTAETCGRSAPAASIFGNPEAVYTRGPYTISVYGYDVASRLSGDTGLFC